MAAATHIDTLLDRTIALGYGNVGLELRRRLPGWPSDPPRMDGKTVLVTGAASGLGLASARGYARLGARVLAVARNDRRARDAQTQILERVPEGQVEGVACDVSSLSALRAMADRIAAEEPHLDVVVNNAGVMPGERTLSADGHELMFATHVLVPFALTRWLGDLLQRSAPSRVINVSSGGMYGQSLPAGDLESLNASYGPKKLYARTKREEVIITELLARSLAGSGVVVHSMHPGWVDTGGVQQWMPLFRKITRPIIRDPEQGADTIVWLGASPEPVTSTGLFWHDRRPRPTHYLIGAGAESEADRQKLWAHCESAIAESETAALTGGTP